MTYDEWFQSQQGTAYDGSYSFAKAAWKHQSDRIESIEQELSKYESGYLKAAEVATKAKFRIDELEQLAKEMSEALEIAGEMASQAMSGYGYYTPDNPHNFLPDIECCTPEEIANHSAACEAYDKGQKISNKPWGIGTYTDEIPDVVKALSRYREVCGCSPQLIGQITSP